MACSGRSSDAAIEYAPPPSLSSAVSWHDDTSHQKPSYPLRGMPQTAIQQQRRRTASSVLAKGKGATGAVARKGRNERGGVHPARGHCNLYSGFTRPCIPPRLGVLNFIRSLQPGRCIGTLPHNTYGARNKPLDPKLGTRVLPPQSII